MREKKATKLTMGVLGVMLGLTLFTNFDNYQEWQNDIWVDRQWERLKDNGLQSFETDGYLIEFVPELKDMRVTKLLNVKNK